MCAMCQQSQVITLAQIFSAAFSWSSVFRMRLVKCVKKSFYPGSIVFRLLRVRSIGKSGFRFSKSKSGFPNRTRNPKTDFTSEKSVLRVDFN